MATLVRKKGYELFAVRVGPKRESCEMGEGFQHIVSEYKDVFKEELPEELPPNRDLEFEIKLKTDEPPPMRPVIRLSTEEIKKVTKTTPSTVAEGSVAPFIITVWRACLLF